MPVSYLYALASTPSGLQAPLALQPAEVRFLPPNAGPLNLNGEPMWIDTREGRELIWEVIRDAEWTTLWAITGGDLAPSANGYIRCVDFGGYGGSDRWGDYSCIIHRPAAGEFGFHWRRRVTVRCTMMERIGDADDYV
jgi:hypothetical protein